MRVLVRKELNMDKPVNLRRLDPAMKVYAGINTKWRETKFYKSNMARRLESEYVMQMQKDEQLKEVLLALIYKELTNNATLKKTGNTCTEMVISVKEEYVDSLKRILEHKDFLPYSIRYIPENEDIRKAFKEMPVLISVSKKTV